MATFMVDPATGRKVLATRKRRGEGCHGKKNLFWKSHGDGLEVLSCRCGRTFEERLRCFRCDGFKEESACTGCAASAAEAAEKARALGRPVPTEEEGELACKGLGGLCCRCAGIPEVAAEI